jgi:hypothetical protein
MAKKKIVRRVSEFDRSGSRRGSESYAAELERYRKGIEAERQSMIDFTAHAQDILERGRLHHMTPELRMRQEIFQKRMALMALTPLQEGVSADSILESAGMFIGLYLASPDMRKGIQKAKAGLLSHAIDRSIENGFDPNGGKVQRYCYMRDRYLAKANDGRVPFTAETAALYDIGLQQQAYDQMKKAGSKEGMDEVMAQFEQARESLKNLAIHDGVNFDDMVHAEHMIVGKRMEADANSADLFYETSFGGFTKDDDEEVTHLSYDAEGKPYMRKDTVWSGGFGKGEGDDREPCDNLFKPRTPITYENMVERFENVNLAHIQYGMGKNDMNVVCNAGDVLDNCMHDIGVPVEHHAPMEGDEFAKKAESGYRKIIHFASQDGRTPSEVREAAAIGSSMASVTMASREMYGEYKGSGMMMSKMALEYAKHTYAAGVKWDADSHKFVQDDATVENAEHQRKVFSLQSLHALEAYGVGPKRKDGMTGKDVAAEMTKRTLSMDALIQGYQSAFRRGVMNGVSPEVMEKYLSKAESETTDQWANGIDQRSQRAAKAETYAKGAYQAFVKHDKNSAFWKDAMASAENLYYDMKCEWEPGSKHDDTVHTDEKEQRGADYKKRAEQHFGDVGHEDDKGDEEYGQ